MMESFRHIKGVTYRDYYSGELSEAHKSVDDFIYNIIKNHNLNEYKVEYRQVGIVNSNDNNPKYGDNYIKSIIDDHGEIVAMAYCYRNGWNGASVVFVNYLE